MLALVGGTVSAIAFAATAPAPQPGSSSQLMNSFLPFFSLFSLSPFSSGSVPVSISSSINATSPDLSLTLHVSTGTVSLSFSNQTQNSYRITGSMAKNSAPPKVLLVGTALGVWLPVGDFTVTLPASLRYTANIAMDTGTLNLDLSGAAVTEVNATLGTGTMSFDVDGAMTRQVALDVSVGMLSGTIHAGGSGVQATASTNTGTASVQGTGLVTVSQAQGFQEVRTGNFDSASLKCVVRLQVDLGTVSAEVG